MIGNLQKTNQRENNLQAVVSNVTDKLLWERNNILKHATISTNSKVYFSKKMFLWVGEINQTWNFEQVFF